MHMAPTSFIPENNRFFLLQVIWQMTFILISLTTKQKVIILMMNIPHCRIMVHFVSSMSVCHTNEACYVIIIFMEGSELLGPWIGILGVNSEPDPGQGWVWCSGDWQNSQNPHQDHITDLTIHISDTSSWLATSPQTSFQGGSRMENLCLLSCSNRFWHIYHASLFQDS